MFVMVKRYGLPRRSKDNTLYILRPAPHPAPAISRDFEHFRDEPRMKNQPSTFVGRFAFLAIALLCQLAIAAERAPNIVFFICDDLGYGDTGPYGQQKIRTPNIDRLASQGIKLTQHYSGHPVCAPSRCVLMTGLHSGHAIIRENRQFSKDGEGQYPIPAETVTLLKLLKQAGYTNGGFGKWGLGPVGSTGDPLKQGLDRFFGYNDQAIAHNYYPTHLWDDSRRTPLNNPPFKAHQKLPADADPNTPASYAAFSGNDYAPDLTNEQALKFVNANKDRPFVLYYPTTVPHLSLQVPADSVKEYEGAFPETPYKGDRGYLPNQTPRATYAAMVTRMDRDFGRVLTLLDELKLADDTIVVFTSDNGPLYNELGGTDAEFFNSAGGLRGRKGGLYEGGIRVPCIVRWNRKIAAGSVADRVCGFEDWMPTLLELIGKSDLTPAGIDGISFAPTLLGKTQEPRPFLYRETPGYGGQQSVRVGDFKIIHQQLNPGPKQSFEPGPLELYDLAKDPTETQDLAAEKPDVVKQLQAVMNAQHQESKLFPIRALDKK
jgi:arylsulfatase A